MMLVGFRYAVGLWLTILLFNPALARAQDEPDEGETVVVPPGSTVVIEADVTADVAVRVEPTEETAAETPPEVPAPPTVVVQTQESPLQLEAPVPPPPQHNVAPSPWMPPRRAPASVDSDFRRFDLGRVAAELVVGLLANGIVFGVTYAAVTSCDGFDCTDDAAALSAATPGMIFMGAAGVTVVGGALGGYGSFWLAVAGAGIGAGITALTAYALASDEDTAIEDAAWPLAMMGTVLPVIGATILYELSAGPLTRRERRRAEAALVPSVGPTPDLRGGVVGLSGTI
ncbi:MAG: hypothetical protein AAGF12_32240 [Myxococcota bacterium]